MDPIITAHGFAAVEIQLHRNRRSNRVRVIVYREVGLDLAALEALTRALQFQLRLIEELSEATLEVSSPGIERTLKAAHEYGIFTGKAVRLLRDGADQWDYGTITDYSDGVVTLDLDEPPRTESIPASQIRKAQLTGAEVEQQQARSK